MRCGRWIHPRPTPRSSFHKIRCKSSFRTPRRTISAHSGNRRWSISITKSSSHDHHTSSSSSFFRSPSFFRHPSSMYHLPSSRNSSPTTAMTPSLFSSFYANKTHFQPFSSSSHKAQEIGTDPPAKIKDTIFQKIIRKEITAKILHEDEHCLAFDDATPTAPIHFLVIPKERINQLSVAEEKHKLLLGHLMLIASAVAKKKGLERGFRVVINDGKNGCESLMIFLIFSNNFIHFFSFQANQFIICIFM